MSSREQDKTREEILSRLNILEFYKSHGFDVKSNSKTEATGLCPLHKDTKPSFSVNLENGLFYCHNASCIGNKGGSVFSFEMAKTGCDFFTALKNLAQKTGVELKGNNLPPLEEHLVNNLHKRLIENEELLNAFINLRGINLESVKKYKIGYSKKFERYSLPIYDEEGNCRNIKYYMPNCGELSKWISHSIVDQKTKKIYGFGVARLFGVEELIKSNDDTVIICEGEFDKIILAQNNILAVTATVGAGKWKDSWNEYFKGKNVILLYDKDEAGENGAKRVASILYKSGIESKIALWTDEVQKTGDVTDWFHKLNKTKEELLEQVLGKAYNWYPEEEASQKEIERGEFIESSLTLSNDVKLIGKRIALETLVSGKDITPYFIPKKVLATCDKGRGEACLRCGMLIKGGVDEIIFNARNKSTIMLTAMTDTQIRKELQACVYAIDCNRLKFEVVTNQKVEELILIPTVKEFSDDRNGSYTQKLVYSIDSDIETNRSYKLIGYSYPNPKNQHATILVDHSTPTQDNISAFVMTDDIKRSLEIFKPNEWTLSAVEKKFEDICMDHSYNVHHIYDRHDLQIMYDLTWHSVLNFNFNRNRVDKGWVECLAIGDSGQGKSEIPKKLLLFHGLGDKITGENMSLAGLIGGVEKFGDRWILTWGQLVLSDKRALVIEELTGITTENLGKITDVRSSGLASITKIRKETTNARVRLIFTSNCRNRKQISSFNYGVESILQVFGTPEDVRRLDLAIVVSTDELDLEVYNRDNTKQKHVDHIYTKEPSKNLILFAWSRETDQVIFEDGAEEAILTAAINMSMKYSSSIPLVEPADQRIKIARLCVAAAARTFSTDETQEKILVRKCHVSFVFKYLNRIYDKKSMGYKEYSEIAKKTEVVDTVEFSDDIEKELFKLPEYGKLCNKLLELNRFKKTEIGDIMGYDTDNLKKVFKNLSMMDCIRSTSNGFIKTPLFTRVLRELKENGKFDILYTNGNGKHGAFEQEELDIKDLDITRNGTFEKSEPF